MPHFCMAVNLRAVWMHSCVTPICVSNPLWLFRHAQQTHKKLQRSAWGLRHLCASQQQCGSVHNLLAGAVAMISSAELPVCACCRCCWLRQGCSRPQQGWRAQRCALIHAPAALTAVPGAVTSMLLAEPSRARSSPPQASDCNMLLCALPCLSSFDTMQCCPCGWASRL